MYKQSQEPNTTASSHHTKTETYLSFDRVHPGPEQTTYCSNATGPELVRVRPGTELEAHVVSLLKELMLVQQAGDGVGVGGTGSSIYQEQMNTNLLV